MSLAHRLDIVDVGKKMKEYLNKSEGFEACGHQAGLELRDRTMSNSALKGRAIAGYVYFVTICQRTS
jgi:hypothetical protein